ncbi:MFS transporter [Rhodococcus sp. CH91]|uniref:MFS transporter n=1 Tax=Rhodococcus sp. CH91 TaxID=2910256 RepID=UPI001F4B89B9|nr:MFS transporter [Rhodococcus sp. CH91]
MTASAAAQGSVFEALRHRGFAVFLTGAFLTNTGGWFQSLAVPFVLFQITGSAAWVGLATAAQFVPIMVFGPYAGALADRVDRRRLVLWMQLIRSLVAFAICVSWLVGWHSPWLLLGLAVATGAAQGVSMPSWQALANDYVPRGSLASAAALNTVQFNLARSFGPAVAGVVLYWWGPAVAFAVTFVMVLSVVVALLVSRPVNAPDRTPSISRATNGRFSEAVRYTWKTPGVLTALAVVFVTGTLGMPIFQHVITFSEDVFDSGELGLAALNLGLGVGTMAGIPLLGRALRRVGRSTVALAAFAGFGITLALFGIAPTVATATAATVGVGTFFLLSLTIGQSTVQILVTDHIRGRVLSISVMVYTGSVALGAALQGALADVLGLRSTVEIAAFLLVAVAVALRFGPQRLRLSRLDDPAETSSVPSTSTVPERTTSDA